MPAKINFEEIIQKLQDSPELLNQFTQFIDGLDYLHLIAKHGPESSEATLYLRENPSTTEKLELIKDATWEQRLFDFSKPGEELHTISRYVEGYFYWKELQDPETNHERQEMIQLGNPEIESDYDFFIANTKHLTQNEYC